MPKWHILLWAAAGCASGPSEETLIDELRVLAVAADPVEVQPGEVVALDALVVDPTGDGAQVLTWTCTPGVDGCLEAALETAVVWDGAAVTTLDGSGVVSSEVTVSPALSAFAATTPTALVASYTLACAPGLCPVFELAGAEAGTADGDALTVALADPFGMLEALPMEGVSLAALGLLVSSRGADERRQSPQLTCAVDVPAVTPGGEVVVTCDVAGDFDDDAGLWGYGTSGGFEAPSVAVGDGDTVPYVWFAPDEQTAEVPLWLVLIDGQGGLAVWEGAVAVAR